MDNSEFESRAYANPDDKDQDFLDALLDDPQRQQLLEEVQYFNKRLTSISSAVSAPDDLAARLKSVADEDLSQTQPTAEKIVKLPTRPLRSFAMAAALVLAVGLTFSSLFGGNQPSAQELEFGQQVVNHVYMELEEIDSRPGASFEQANQVFGAVGGSIASPQAMNTLGVSLAKPCVIVPQSSSAHLVVNGNMGSVNVIVVNNNPVREQFSFSEDRDRFEVVVIPMENGNLILIGEKNETFAQVRRELDDNVSWVI